MQVKSKIEHLEKSFQKAYEFSFTETGQQLMERSEGTFHDAILKICPHYFDLFDVMKDHSSLKPQINSEELDEIIAEPLTTDNEENSLIDNNNIIHPNNQNDGNTESQEKSHPNSQSSNNMTIEVVATTADIVPVATP